MSLNFLQWLGVGSVVFAVMIYLIQRRAEGCPDHTPVAGMIAWLLIISLVTAGGWLLWQGWQNDVMFISASSFVFVTTQ